MLNMLMMLNHLHLSFSVAALILMIEMENAFKSSWEARVATALQKSKIAFEYEPKRFHLTPRIRYTPDFILKLRTNQKEIVLEPHGIIDPEDFQKFSLFRRLYGHGYFLILLVHNDDIPLVSEDAFDDIWPIEYTDLLPRQLRGLSSAG